jgi:hypothetical protein
MNWRDELKAILQRAEDADLPDMAGELARAQAIVALRLRDGESSRRRGSHANGLRHLKAEDVAKLLNVDVSWVYRNKKRLGAVSLADGGAVRFPEAAFRRFLERQKA